MNRYSYNSSTQKSNELASRVVLNLKDLHISAIRAESSQYENVALPGLKLQISCRYAQIRLPLAAAAELDCPLKYSWQISGVYKLTQTVPAISRACGEIKRNIEVKSMGIPQQMKYSTSHNKRSQLTHWKEASVHQLPCSPNPTALQVCVQACTQHE